MLPWWTPTSSNVCMIEMYLTNKSAHSYLPLVMYTTTSIMMPTLLNINAVNWRQWSLARSANGGLGKLCRLRNDLNDLCRSIVCACVFHSFSLEFDDHKQNMLIAMRTFFSLVQQKNHAHRCLPIGFFVSRPAKILRNYSNRPIKSHSLDSHIILILTASITNSSNILSTMSYHNILCILGFFSLWFIDFVWRLNDSINENKAQQ